MPPARKRKAAALAAPATPPEPAPAPDRRASGLLAWLKDRGAAVDGLAFRATPGGDLGVFATRPLAAGRPIGQLPRDAVLDPVAVLAADPVALRALRHGAAPPCAFYLALAHSAGDPSHPFQPYLAALPRASPEPCAWPPGDRALLDGTPLAAQVAAQRARLEAEFVRVGPLAAPGVPLERFLWARGVHISRCFPRALVAAAALPEMHRVAASAEIDASMAVPHAPSAARSGGASTGSTAPPAVADAAAAVTCAADPAADAAPPSGGDAGCSGGGAPDPGQPDAAPAVAATDSDVAAAGARGAGSAESGDGGPDCELGCMLPLFDMMDHDHDHPVVWEAGRGCIRFRAHRAARAGDPLYLSYGAKGNGELLFRYGFATPGNRHDRVEGLVVGLQPTPDAGLADARARLLQEHGIPHATRADGVLLVGPFELHDSSCASDGEATRDGGEGESAGGGVLPAELLFALGVVGMEAADDEPAVTPDELELLHALLSARLRPLLPREAADARAPPHTREGYVAAYRDGQRRLLRAALDEIAAMSAAVDDG